MMEEQSGDEKRSGGERAETGECNPLRNHEALRELVRKAIELDTIDADVLGDALFRAPSTIRTEWQRIRTLTGTHSAWEAIRSACTTAGSEARAKCIHY